VINGVEFDLVMKKYKGYKINYFILGGGSSFDIAGNYYRAKHRKLIERSDLDSIAKDWKVVGEGLAIAIESASQDISQKHQKYDKK